MQNKYSFFIFCVIMFLLGGCMIKIDGNNPTGHEYFENIFCLDNFSAFSVVVDGVEYKTAEHAFQTIKFLMTNKKVAEEIRCSSSPFDARRLAHKYKKLRREDWSDVKYDIMEKILYEKTIQNEYVKEKLLATKNNRIVEDCGEDDDKDWGCGLDGTGENNLGKIWMKIREKLLKVTL